MLWRMTSPTADQTEPPPRRTTRRRSLVKLGGAVAAALGATAWEAAPEADAAGNGPAAVAAGLVTCVLTPEQTEGPYYIDGAKVRRDVREGRPGTPLTLKTTVVDVSTCKPIKGASVEIWHCDAGGVPEFNRSSQHCWLTGLIVVRRPAVLSHGSASVIAEAA